MRRGPGLLLAAFLFFMSFEALTPGVVYAWACVNAPNTPVEYGVATTCTSAQSQSMTAAYNYAQAYCAGYCTSVCFYTYHGQTNCIPENQFQTYSGYGSFGCLTALCTPNPAQAMSSSAAPDNALSAIFH